MGFGPSAIARRVSAFTKDTRAGATAIASAAVTVMTVGAAALITDHVWLIDQRDTLKFAAEAASIAATLEIDRQLAADPRISDDDLKAALQPVAASYAFVNLLHLPIDRLLRARDTLEVQITDLDRAQRSVGVTATADLGGTLFSRNLPLLGRYAGPEKIAASAGVESESAPVEVVLAIDVSGSMTMDLNGQYRDFGRINAVKHASKSLVAILDPSEDSRVAVGIVPWAVTVRLDRTTARKWERNGWAQYPAQRTYPVPYSCPGSGGCTPDAVVDTLPASRPDGWRYCLDGHRVDGGISKVPASTATALFELPSVTPFAQSYFQPNYAFTYRCVDASERPVGSFHRCGSMWGGGDNYTQHGCYNNDQASLVPLSTERATIESKIDALKPTDGNTYSTLGVLWAQRMLDPAWRGVWGQRGIHPADPNTTEYAGIRKAIVLLTDGEDTYCWMGNPDCSDSPMAVSRTKACAAAKAQGTEIFVVAAMPSTQVSGAFGQTLRACSSETDQEYPRGTRRRGTTYVFLNNSTRENLEAAFAKIANQLRTLRRVS